MTYPPVQPPAGPLPAQVPGLAPARETAALKYARHTRNAVVFMAIVVAAGLVASLIIGVQVAKLNGANSSGSGFYSSSSSSNCLSVGGTNPSC
jgi:hypothetical protein